MPVCITKRGITLPLAGKYLTEGFAIMNSNQRMVLRNTTKPVTQADIAKALGVSQATVGLVVGRTLSGRGKEKLKPETIEKIRMKALEMGYRPHRHAQVMRQGKTMIIGMIHAGGMLQVSNERAYHVTQALKAQGYQLITMDIYHQKAMDDIVDHLVESRVDGVLLACTTVADHIAPLRKQGIPMIGLSSDEIPGVPLVRCDMRDGFYKLVRHLTQQGCRKLVQLNISADPSIPIKDWRWQMALPTQGFKDAITDSGGAWTATPLDDYSKWTHSTRGSNQLRGTTLCLGTVKRDKFNPYLPGIDLAERLWAAGLEKPDAILCPNDDWAYGISSNLLRQGVRIPQDVAITGFNNSSLGEAFFVPLTSVRQPTKEMADLAVDFLIRKINGEYITAGVHSLAGTLVLRDSSIRNLPDVI